MSFAETAILLIRGVKHTDILRRIRHSYPLFVSFSPMVMPVESQNFVLCLQDVMFIIIIMLLSIYFH